MSKQSLAMAYAVKRMGKTKQPRPQAAPVLEAEPLEASEPVEPDDSDLSAVPAEETESAEPVTDRKSLIASIIRRLKV